MMRLLVICSVFLYLTMGIAPLNKTHAQFPGGDVSIPANESNPPPSKVNITGKAYLKNTNKSVFLADIPIYEVDSNDKLAKLATTGSDGGYTISLKPGRHILFARSDQFIIDRDYKLQLTNGMNVTADLELEPQVLNRINGQLITNNPELRSSYIALLKDKQLFSGTISFSSGQFQLRNIPAGKYELIVLNSKVNGNIGLRDGDDYTQSKLKTWPETISVDFSTNTEKPKDVSISLVDTRPSTQKNLTIKVFSDSVPSFSTNEKITSFIGEELKGAQVQLLKNGRAIGNKQNAPAEYKNLLAGIYEIRVSLASYKTIEAEIDLTFPNQYEAVILSSMQKNYCENVPQNPNSTYGEIKYFWFCGYAAKTYKDSDQVHEITKVVQSLHQDYGYLSAPQQIIITSDPITNANHYYFTGRDGACLPIPNQSAQPFRTEALVISATMLKNFSPEKLGHVVVHEWGHVRNYYKRDCKGVYSEHSDEYRMLYNASLNFSDSMLATIKDSTFHTDDKVSGHPQESSDEMYASIFHAYVNHPTELKKRTEALKSQQPNFYRIMMQLIKLTVPTS